MTLHIYCYNKHVHRLNALDYIPEGYKVWTEYAVSRGEFLMPAQECSAEVILLYKSGRLKFLVTSNSDLLNNILNIVVESGNNSCVKVYWWCEERNTFIESYLNDEGDLVNWSYGYLY